MTVRYLVDANGIQTNPRTGKTIFHRQVIVCGLCNWSGNRHGKTAKTRPCPSCGSDKCLVAVTTNTPTIKQRLGRPMRIRN